MLTEFDYHHGSVAEWLKAAVLKTVVLKGTRGSNPLASAILQEPLEWLKTTGFSAGRNYANKATADAPQVQNPLASAIK